MRPVDAVFTRSIPRRTAENRNPAAPGAGREVPAGVDGAVAWSSDTFALRSAWPDTGQE